MSPTPQEQLDRLRAEIDRIDEQLSTLLQQRIGIVKQVAALKAEHWPSSCHIRSGREGMMHQRIAQRFAGSDFPVAAALAIWRHIIGASTHVESQLKIATTSAAQAAMAREYFGVTAEISTLPALQDALGAITAKRCTILFADASDLPVIRAVAPKLKIFAAVPLVPGDTPITLALADITPEPSGDDISYYLENGQIVTRDGFEETPQWLGAHPRPIIL